MKYYFRLVYKCESVNKFGKKGYVRYIEYFKTSSDEVYRDLNKGKRNVFGEFRFDSMKYDSYRLKLRHLDSDKVYTEIYNESDK